MAISRCNQCACLQEQPDGQIGERIACLQCGSPTTVYPTLFFVGKLLEKYFAAQRELIGLRKAAGSAAPQQADKAEKARTSEEIDKYLGLRKRLGLSGSRFVMCIASLSDEHAKGLTAMYDLTFVSEQGLLPHLGTLF